MAKEPKYYLVSRKTGQAIKTNDSKHPSFWHFFRKEFDNIKKKYEKVAKDKGFYGLIFHSQIPKISFDKKNWAIILKETKLKGDAIDVCIGGTNATFVKLELDDE